MIVTPRMIKACEYKDFISPDEWALKYYHLEKESAIGGGKFSFNFAPHTRKPLQVLGDEDVSEVVLWFASQAGKTTIGMIALNHYMDNVGGNAMFFLPSDDLIAFTATDRILPSITRTINKDSVLQEKEERALRDNTRNIRYLGGTIRILSSTKPANRKSTPARFIVLDEISEMKHQHVEEISERAKTYELFGGKILKTSTAMSEDDPIVSAYKTSIVRYEYEVMCPYCKKSHVDNFLENIVYPPMGKFNIDESLSDAERTKIYANLASAEAKYKCPHCNALWDDKDKDNAIIKGGWAIKSEAKEGKSVGFKASSFISRFVTIKTMTQKFILADNDEKKAVFYRGWLNQIYVPEIKTTPIETLEGLKGELGELILPKDCIGLFCAIDVQKDHYYFSVVAVNSKLDKFVVEYGRVENEADLITFMTTRSYRMGDSQTPYFVEVFAVDSGAWAEEIYRFCYSMSHYFDDRTPDKEILLERRGGQIITVIPIKGSNSDDSTAMNTIGHITNLDGTANNRSFADTLQLHTINTYFFKDSIMKNISNVLEKTNGEKLFIHSEMREDILKSLVSETKQEVKKKNGKIAFRYAPVHSHPFNHYLDTLTYNYYLIARLGVQYRASAYNLQKPKPKPQRAKRDYLDEF